MQSSHVTVFQQSDQQLMLSSGVKPQGSGRVCHIMFVSIHRSYFNIESSNYGAAIKHCRWHMQVDKAFGTRNTNLASEGPACLVLGGEDGRLLGILNGGLAAVQYLGAARVQEL